MNIILFIIKIVKYSVNYINTLIVFYTTNRYCFKMTSIKPNLKSCFKKQVKVKVKVKVKVNVLVGEHLTFILYHREKLLLQYLVVF